MPSIEQFVEKDTKKKKFQKVSHRPWTVITSDAPANNSSTDTIPENKDISPPSVYCELPPPALELVVADAQHLDKNILSHAQISDDENAPAKPDQFTNNSKTILEQFMNNSKTVLEPFTNNSKTIQEQTVNSSRTTYAKNADLFVNNSKTIHEQFMNNPASLAFATLVGFQKELFLYIAKRCMQNEALTSGPITKQDFKEHIKQDLDTTKTTIQRLLGKGLIKREMSKSGSGGFSIFSISEAMKEVLKSALDSKTIHEQFMNSSKTSHAVNRYQADPSSSYNNIYINTTTDSDPLFMNCSPIVHEQAGEGEQKIFLENIKKIDIAPLAHIGFSVHHAEQALNFSELTVEMINDSIQAFAFDLEKNNVAERIKTHPLNYFMGILRSKKPYAAPSNFEDPKVIAMRQYLERKKNMRDERKKMEDEIFQFEFEEWSETLSDEDVNTIIPDKRHREYPMREGFLKTHFREIIFQKQPYNT